MYSPTLIIFNVHIPIVYMWRCSMKYGNKQLRKQSSKRNCKLFMGFWSFRASRRTDEANSTNIPNVWKYSSTLKQSRNWVVIANIFNAPFNTTQLVYIWDCIKPTNCYETFGVLFNEYGLPQCNLLEVIKMNKLVFQLCDPPEITNIRNSIPLNNLIRNMAILKPLEWHRETISNAFLFWE